MLEEFDKMEFVYHETMKRENKEHGEDIGRLRAKQAYDEEILFQRWEEGLHQEISALRTAFERNGRKITLLKESSIVDQSRSDNERPNSNRVKRQKMEIKKENNVKTIEWEIKFISS